MEQDQIRKLSKDAIHLVVLLALIGVVLGMLTWAGIVRCSWIPGWCDVYWGVTGKPDVLIVYGEDGLGDAQLLRKVMQDPNILGVYATTKRLDQISEGNLKEYSLVIVTHAKTISTKKLQDFMDYVNKYGGRLVWTGDAGTLLTEDDNYLYWDEKPDGKAEHTIIGPWARKKGEDIIGFDEFLGLRYKANYCEIKDCTVSVEPHIGGLEKISGTEGHRLVIGLAPGLQMYGDYAIVEETTSISPTNIVLTVESFGNIVGEDGENYGKSFPIIVSSGMGERVVYYAIPPENFLKDTQEKKYPSFIENMYYGMLK